MKAPLGSIQTIFSGIIQQNDFLIIFFISRVTHFDANFFQNSKLLFRQFLSWCILTRCLLLIKDHILIFFFFWNENKSLNFCNRGHSITTWTRFWLFDYPFFTLNGDKKKHCFIHLPKSSCPNSFWTTPRVCYNDPYGQN